MKMLRPLLVLALLVAASFSSASCRPADAAVYAKTRAYNAAPIGGPTKVWCIGDSFMHGAIYNGSGYGYFGAPRSLIYSAMVAAGANPSFVGTQLNASESPPVTNAGVGHDGLNGSSAAQWVASYFATKVAQFSGPSDMPHVVFIIAGNNDVDASAAGTAIGQLVDLVAAAAPRASIFVSTVLPAPTVPRTATNAQLRIEIAARVARGIHVTLMEMQALTGATTQRSDLPDTQHPSADLYRRMGEAMALTVAPLLN